MNLIGKISIFIVVVLLAAIASACFAFREDLFSSNAISSGTVSKLDLPTVWVRDKRFEAPGIETYKGRMAGSEVTLRQIRPTKQAQSLAFKKMLEGPPHQLTADELEVVHQLLKESATDKPPANTRPQEDSLSGRTTTIDSKTVVDATQITEAPYACYQQCPELDGNYWNRIILADADGTGALIQQITVRSKLEHFPIIKAQIEPRLNQIQWK